ncbi:hypothetical protein Kpol_1053p45 [Vanderwaltozyma polyspora DSM 70294]|uniref:Uncharacterized protein n=1 Tax=Vanderwaltozyma polyspora (strain ATCC 22028 / DSM 70294 / BCRC 21397 / CBS 2163 / NBRC 10782 / NRRL Y-8283 / UCD 57-17) TaxID=436907 RepID=A7TN89_VANPO|nr:uncharacterized protein Kpol_1053p45 [Vanderwaltozyma polyspora DSM 70294]EDO16307.1 hypothetical protein Kpol_1053p45 [Vanderwaltozyma polyspora DSM 70294]
MDTVASVNRLRSQFLQICPEKDQMRRIMKPYRDENLPHNEMDGKLKDAYILSSGRDILSELISPPITQNFMDKYSLSHGSDTREMLDRRRRKTSYINTDTIKGSVDNSSSKISDENDISYQGTASDVLQNTTVNTDEIDYSSNSQVPVSNSMNITDSQNNSLQTLKNNITSNPTDPEIALNHNKISRKSTSRFARLFTGKKENNGNNNNNNHNNVTNSNNNNSGEHNTGNQRNNQNNSQANSQHHNNNSDSMRAQNVRKRSVSSFQKTHSKKPSAFDMNFDYDENLDEEDDEDEDEDDETDDKNVHAKFFQLDSSPNNISEPHLRNEVTSIKSGNATSDSGSNNGVSTNISKRISHFPQNMITRGVATDSKTNQSKNEKISNSKLAKKDNSLEGNLSDENASNHINRRELNNSISDDEENVISYIDSFINEHDLNNLTKEEHRSSLERSEYFKNSPESEIVRLDSVAQENINLDNESDLSGSEIEDGDNLSSYGKSLLFSDFSADDFSKSRAEFHGLKAVPHTDTIGSNGTPILFNNFKFDNEKDSIIDDGTFDKDSPKTPNYKRHNSNEQKLQGISTKNYNGKGTSGRRSSLPSLNFTKSHSNKIRDPNANRNYRKVLRNIDYTYKKPRRNSTDLTFNQTPSTLSVPFSSTSSRRNSATAPLLVIEKVTDFKNAKPQESHLSSLFKKKQDVSNPSELLDYFSFVSGSKVPKYEGLKLSIYIHDSKKYKREPFETTVRKTATVFEVIGFSLFLYATSKKPEDFELDGLTTVEIQDPNSFSLHIVDEDGEPFEDNFGKLDRTRPINTISDNEVTLCKVGSGEKEKNEAITALPYDLDGKIHDTAINDITSSSISKSVSTEKTINQLSYYKPIVGNNDNLEKNTSTNSLKIKVYLYPNINPKFNYTYIKVLVTANINDILVKYCKMKNMDPNEYLLKVAGKNLSLDLNDTVLRLDGNNEVEIISKKDAREIHLEKIKPNMKKPVLPTIQSNDLTPLTLEQNTSYLKYDAPIQEAAPVENKKAGKSKKHSRYKLTLTKQNSDPTNNNGSSSVVGSSFFKSRNSSKSSLHGSLPYFYPNKSNSNLDDYSNEKDDNTYQDLITGAYHKYRVWRRQQMSLINKHERTLALDGDYIYIVPPDRHMHWHENVKTKSFHISQVVLVKRSKRIPEYFKIYVKRGQDDIKRYYFEAVSLDECKEIVSRIQSLLSAYRMNHKK